MIYRKIKITGREDRDAYIPESWDDVDHSQLQELYVEEDPLKRVAILTGIPYNFFNDYPELADFYVWVEDKLSWSNELKEEKGSIVAFNIDGKIFHFPEDIGVLSIGLYNDVRNELRAKQDNIISAYPFICAAYYQLIRDGVYDYTKAYELVDVFEDQPCSKVNKAAGFFLNKVTELKSGTKKSVKDRAIRWIRKLQVMTKSRKSLGLTTL